MTNESRGKGSRRVTINGTTQHQHNRHQITRDGHQQGKSPDAITVLTGLLLKTQTSLPLKFRSSAVPLLPICGLIGLIAWFSCANVCPLPNPQICSYMLTPCRLAVDFQQCEEMDVHNWVKCSCQLWLLHGRIHLKHRNEDNDDESMHYAAIPIKDRKLQKLAPLLLFSWVFVFQTKYLDITGLISFTFNIYIWGPVEQGQLLPKNQVKKQVS